MTGRLLSEITGWSVQEGTDPATDDRIVQFGSAYRELDALIEDPPRTLADVLDALNGLGRLGAIGPSRTSPW